MVDVQHGTVTNTDTARSKTVWHVHGSDAKPVVVTSCCDLTGYHQVNHTCKCYAKN